MNSCKCIRMQYYTNKKPAEITHNRFLISFKKFLFYLRNKALKAFRIVHRKVSEYFSIQLDSFFT